MDKFLCHVNKDNNSSDSCQFFVSRRNLPILNDGVPECNILQRLQRGPIVFRCTPKRLARSFERNHLVGCQFALSRDTVLSIDSAKQRLLFFLFVGNVNKP